MNTGMVNLQTPQIWRSGDYIYSRGLAAGANIKLYQSDGRCVYQGPAAQAIPAPQGSGILFWELRSGRQRWSGKLAGA
jgi:hypothetical protein